MVDAALLSRVKTMSPADRLELLGAVWETLSPVDASVTEEDKALLDVRLADLESNPKDQSPWSEVKARLEKNCLGLCVDKGTRAMRSAYCGLRGLGNKREPVAREKASGYAATIRLTH